LNWSEDRWYIVALLALVLAAVVIIGPDFALSGECTGTECGQPADSPGGGAGAPPPDVPTMAAWLRGGTVVILATVGYLATRQRDE
jgi:hypothetical protein